MELSCEGNFPRFRGTVKEIAYTERPLCGTCKKPMRVASHSKARMVVGRDEDYASTTVYYWCGNPACAACKTQPVHQENPFVPPDGVFDWEVIGTACLIRWSKHFTYDEIIDEFARNYGIKLCRDTVERFLKTYEIACEAKYRPEFIEKIQENGGVIPTRPPPCRLSFKVSSASGAPKLTIDLGDQR